MSKFDELSKSFDKTKLNKRMDRLATEMFPDPNKKTNFYMPGLDGKMHNVPKIDLKEALSQGNWEELEKTIKEYNSKVTDLDKDYTTQQPLHNFIVRCFHLEAEKKGDIYIPFTSPVRVGTQNGIGTLETRESKWPYSTKAIIVSAPPMYSESLLKEGDIVQLDASVTLAEQRSKEHPMVLPYSYTLPEYTSIIPPTDLKDKHFGYLLVPLQSIITKVKQ